MGFFGKFIVRIVLNGLTLYIATLYFPGFMLAGGLGPLVIGAVALATLHTFLRPLLRLVATPLVWITFGLFNIVIHVAILWIADQLLATLTISNLTTLFWVSIIMAIVNFF